MTQFCFAFCMTANYLHTAWNTIIGCILNRYVCHWCSSYYCRGNHRLAWVQERNLTNINVDNQQFVVSVICWAWLAVKKTYNFSLLFSWWNGYILFGSTSWVLIQDVFSVCKNKKGLPTLEQPLYSWPCEKTDLLRFSLATLMVHHHPGNFIWTSWNFSCLVSTCYCRARLSKHCVIGRTAHSYIFVKRYFVTKKAGHFSFYCNNNIL